MAALEVHRRPLRQTDPLKGAIPVLTKKNIILLALVVLAFAVYRGKVKIP